MFEAEAGIGRRRYRVYVLPRICCIYYPPPVPHPSLNLVTKAPAAASARTHATLERR
jgi:hypothetical protein